jgi:predicted MFS family arabinose efflux permease
VPGLLTSAISIFGLNYGLIQGSDYGWTSGRIIASFIVAAVFLVVFIAIELRTRAPMLDLSLFRDRTFAGANVNGLLMFIALFTYIIYFSIFLQTVLRYSAVQAGASFLVSSFALMFAAPAAGALSDKIGPRLPMAVGMAMFGVSMVFVSRLEESASFWNFAPWLLVGGAGFGLLMPPMTALILESADPDKAGVASGVMQVFRQLGGGLGVAIMGAVVTAHLNGLTPGLPGYASDFTSAFQRITLVAAVVSFTSALIAFFAVRDRAEAVAAETAIADGGQQ